MQQLALSLPFLFVKLGMPLLDPDELYVRRARGIKHSLLDGRLRPAQREVVTVLDSPWRID